MISFSVSQEYILKQKHSQTLIWTLFDIERDSKMFLTHYRDQTNHLENSERHVLQSHFGSLIFSALLFCAHLLLQAHVCAWPGCLLLNAYIPGVRGRGRNSLCSSLFQQEILKSEGTYPSTFNSVLKEEVNLTSTRCPYNWKCLMKVGVLQVGGLTVESQLQCWKAFCDSLVVFYCSGI